MGADVAVDATAEDFAEVAGREGGADVVLDMVGAPYFEQKYVDLEVEPLHRRNDRAAEERRRRDDRVRCRGVAPPTSGGASTKRIARAFNQDLADSPELGKHTGLSPAMLSCRAR